MNLGSVKYRFPNNYGASVVQNEYSYGGDAGYYEIAVLKFHSDNNEDYTLDYDKAYDYDVYYKRKCHRTHKSYVS